MVLSLLCVATQVTGCYTLAGSIYFADVDNLTGRSSRLIVMPLRNFLKRIVYKIADNAFETQSGGKRRAHVPSDCASQAPSLATMTAVVLLTVYTWLLCYVRPLYNHVSFQKRPFYRDNEGFEHWRALLSFCSLCVQYCICFTICRHDTYIDYRWFVTPFSSLHLARTKSIEIVLAVIHLGDPCLMPFWALHTQGS